MSELPDPARAVALRKRELRRELLARRRATDTSALQDALLGVVLAAVEGHDVVAAYAPLRDEPGGADLPAVLAAHARLLLPVLRADRDLDWAGYTGDLPPGPGLREPSGPRVPLSEASLVLVPALAVDRRTHVRLGRGGGSYDRVLTRVDPAVPVYALIYPWELVDGVPAQPHDRPVSGALSSDGLLTR